jgi:hypothetical protein
MSTYWQSYEGYVFNGLYPLLTLLQADDEAATFSTEYGEERRPATIHLFQVESTDSARRLANWRKAMALSHPSLLHIYEYGDGTFEDTPAVFVVSECTEDNLAAVLSDRALTEAETLEVAETVSGTLAYLHDKGLVHGSLEPAHVLAIDNQIKISSDSVSPAESGNQPEADVWAFGLLILQCLTQTTPETTDIQQSISRLPDRFREIVAHSLQPDPGERWTAARIYTALQGNSASFLQPVRAPDEPFIVPKPPAGPKPGKVRYLAILAVGIIAAGLGLYVTKPATIAPDTASRSRTEPVPTPVPAEQAPAIPQPVKKTPEAQAPSAPIPAPVRATPPPTVVPQKAVVPQKPVLPKAVAPQTSANQFVIVATYNRIEDARKRANSITSRWPAFPADVHSVTPNQAPYLVIIGANLSKEAAQQLQRKARAAGLPRDTYYQSFNP